MKFINTLDISILLLFIARLVVIEFEGSIIITMLAWVAMYCVAAFVLLVIGSHYVSMINGTLKGGLKIITPTLLGVWVLSVISVYNYDMIFKDIILNILFITYIIFFSILGRRVYTRIVKRFPLREEEKSMIVDVFPPKSMSDMWKFHAIIIFLMLLPFFMDMYWSGINR